MVLPAMAALVAAYIAAHTPILRLIGRVAGRQVQRCYFTCSGWAPNGHALDALAAVLSLLLAAAAAWLVAARLCDRRAERWLAFGLLAPAFVTVPASLLGVAGWLMGGRPLQPPAGPLLTGVPAAAAVAVGVMRGWWQPLAPNAWPPGRPTPLTVLLAATALMLLVTSAVIALGHPPTGYDAVSYHGPLGVYFWRDGNLGLVLDEQPWAWALAHPGTMELWAGLLRLGGGEGIANLAQLPFAMLGACAIYVFARHTGLRRGGAALGALAFLISPIVVLQAGMQLNDLTASSLILVAAALASAPADRWSVTRLSLTGLALGLAMATKLSMLPAVAAVVLYLLPQAMRARRPWAAIAAVGAFALVVIPWWTRNLVLYANPIYPAALPILGRGYVLATFGTKDAGFVPGAAAWPLYPLLDPHSELSGFGPLFAAGALPGVVAGALWGRRSPVILYGLLVGIGLPAWWRLTSHEPRFIFHLFGLGFAFLGWCLVAVPRRHRRIAVWLLGAGAIFSAAVTVDQALGPAARQPTDRAEFYDRVWGVDSVAAAVPEAQAMLSHTGFAQLSYAADYPLLGRGLQRRLVSIDGQLPTDSIITIMRPRGIRYVYLPAAPDSQQRVEAMYPSDRFELVHSSIVADGGRRGTRRYLFRLRDPAGATSPVGP
jgi:hypothetical protein